MFFFDRRRIIEDETESLQRDIEHLKTRLGESKSHGLGCDIKYFNFQICFLLIGGNFIKD